MNRYRVTVKTELLGTMERSVFATSAADAMTLTLENVLYPANPDMRISEIWVLNQDWILKVEKLDV